MANKDIKNLIFVDCEADGKSPSTGKMTEFGAAAYPSKATFHGVLVERKPSGENQKFRVATGKTLHDHNPVNDAMGNLEAFERLLNGER